MVSSILDPAALVPTITQLLPPNGKHLANPQDGVAVLFHAILTTLSFRLVSVDDASPARTFPDNVLPVGWNKYGPSNYSFRYKHEQSSLEFLLKVSKLGSRTLTHGIALESDKAASMDISTNDFVSTSFYPYEADAPNAQPLIHGFISSHRVSDLTTRFQLAILQKLVPGLRKDGYTEVTEDTSTSSTASSPPPAPYSEPSRPLPVTSPSVPNNQSMIPPRNPLEIGRRDLDPFPRNPFAPPPLFPDNNGDGMFVGPNHPIFGGGLRGPTPGGQGPWGGDGFLPPMGAPPGARFDPIVPGMGPTGAFPGGFPGPRRRTDPDNDEFMPPGTRDMYS